MVIASFTGCADDAEVPKRNVDEEVVADSGTDVAKDSSNDSMIDGGLAIDAGSDGGAVDAPRIECQPGDETGEAVRGTGTIEDPVIICSVEQLLAMDPDEGSYHVLGTDLAMSETYESSPLGGEFFGSLDGQGFSVSGMTIESNTSAGLFEVLRGRVTGLRLLDVSVSSAGNTVGALAARVDSVELRDIEVSGVVSGQNKVGGVFGEGAGVIHGEQLRFSGEVNGGFDSIGGIAGYSRNLTLTDVFVTADVVGAGEAIGGVIGDGGSELVNVHFNGTVSGWRVVGGLTGQGVWLDYQSVSAVGTLRATSLSGGLVGSVSGMGTVAPSIENSFVQMEFEPQENRDELQILGGLIGNWGQDFAVRNSYVVATVRANDLQRVTFGGIAGQPGRLILSDSFVVATFETANVPDLKIDMIAPNGGRVIASNFWWDAASSGELECHPFGNPDIDTLDCNAVGPEMAGWFFDSSNEPMAGWDFAEAGPWESTAGEYPNLRR